MQAEKENQKYTVLGLMSGSSLDGIDLALCEFTHDTAWSYKIFKATTLPYTRFWVNKIKSPYLLTGLELIELDHSLGKFYGNRINNFLSEIAEKPIAIASHGHTIFHQPQNGFTLQIGHGADIFATTSIPTINDFRSLDVALGGQGAPLVPIGDTLLFPDFPICLNLGGIANLSYWQNGKFIAYDICPLNQVLNYYAEKEGLPYDNGGQIAKSGQINNDLLQKLNHYPYYKLPFPKSLANEEIAKNFLSIFPETISVPDALATAVEHCAMQIASSLNQSALSGNILTTGGGAWNTHLINTIQSKLNPDLKIHIPDAETINFKESIIFAFLGLLNILGESNTLKSITGAKTDSIGGVRWGF